MSDLKGSIRKGGRSLFSLPLLYFHNILLSELGTLSSVVSFPQFANMGMMGEMECYKYAGFHNMTGLLLFFFLYLQSYIYQFLHHCTSSYFCS